MFAIKSLLKNRPYLFVVVLSLTFLIILSFIMKVIEAPIYYQLVDSDPTIKDYTTFINSAWSVIVTMTTIGYGDFFPRSNLGRFVVMLNAVLGNLIVSLMILSLQNSMFFNTNEDKAFNEILRLTSEKEVEDESAKLFSLTFRFLSSKKKYRRLIQEDQNSNGRSAIFSVISRFNRIEKEKSRLKSILFDKVVQEKQFLSKLHSHRNDFGYLTESIVFESQVEDLQKFREGIEDKSTIIETHMSEMSKALYLLETSVDLMIEKSHKDTFDESYCMDQTEI